MIKTNIELLIQYGLKASFFKEEDSTYMKNRICDYLGLESFITKDKIRIEKPMTQLLEEIVAWAYDSDKVASKQAPYSDLYETALMDIMLPRPSEVNRKFSLLQKTSAKDALDWYYNFSKASNYIRVDRIARNKKWKVPSSYGDIDISINLSKPEKDPRAIEAAAKKTALGYPSCLLCYENEGYAGRIDHPARNSHRVINIELDHEPWFIQYSPYGYYNEHAIVINKSHTPMKISKDTFVRLADFVDQYKHYFIGSNADLPLVGGSLLSHDHYQAGHYTMPMALAENMFTFKLNAYPGLEASWLKWPMSVIRLKSNNKDDIINGAELVRNVWVSYSDETLGIKSRTENELHHTITPIMRKNNSTYELDITLRDNRRNAEYPDGIFHPHKEIHPIKKENIGLIEVMGLAVLPARLDEIMQTLIEAINKGISKELIIESKDLEAFGDLYEEMRLLAEDSHTAEAAVKLVMGQTFLKGLEHCGVFKLDEIGREGMKKFIRSLNC